MTGGIITVVVIAGVTALVAWAVATRGLRPPGGPEARDWGGTIRRFDLTAAEAIRVEEAATFGRRLEDERLRQATSAWARAVIERTGSRRLLRPPWVGFLVRVLLLASLIVVGAWGYDAVFDGIPWGLVVVQSVFIAVDLWVGGGPRRALRRNADPSESPPGAH